jgi:hypothetical protein
MNELSRSGRKVVSKRLFNLYRLANWVGLLVFARYLLLRLFNVAFQAGLGSTRFIYTARGVFGISIRKFFEIPAAGAYLIFSPSNGFAELGFAGGVHYLKAESEELLQVVKDLESDVQQAQVVAHRGQRMVWQYHSLVARAGQLRRCLESAKARSYTGAYWRDGEFSIEELG